MCFVSPLTSSPLPCPDHSSLIVYTTDTTIVYYRLVSADNLSEIIDATLYGFHEILILTLPRRISIWREHPPPTPRHFNIELMSTDSAVALFIKQSLPCDRIFRPH